MELNNLLKRISVDPNIHHGSPCIKGTRTPVFVILEALAEGLATDEIKVEYPPVSEEDIKAALLFAALLAKEEEIPLTAFS